MWSAMLMVLWLYWREAAYTFLKYVDNDSREDITQKY